jgi:hypothetical protein
MGSGKAKVELKYCFAIEKNKAEVQKHISLGLNIEFLHLVELNHNLSLNLSTAFCDLPLSVPPIPP